MTARKSVVLVLGVLGSVLGSAQVLASGRADPPAERKLRPIPFFPGDEPPLVMVTRGENTWLGDYDKNGNFLPDPRFPPNLGRNGGSVLPRFVLGDVSQNYAYEYRSGRVVKGTQVDEPFGVFVPEIGSTVLDIKDIDLKKPDRMVLGMPEVIPAYVAERKRKFGDGPAPKAPDPPKAGTPPGFTLKLFREMAPDKRPPAVARIIGEVMEFGHLTDEGEFAPDPDLPVLPRVEVKYTHRPSYAWNAPFYYTLPRAAAGKEEVPETEEVYEYRSGRLIKGTLHKTGNFAPEVGSTVIDFKDYDLFGRRRIYNLPGVIRPVKK